jgi:hypothetical protein
MVLAEGNRAQHYWVESFLFSTSFLLFGHIFYLDQNKLSFEWKRQKLVSQMNKQSV